MSLVSEDRGVDVRKIRPVSGPIWPKSSQTRPAMVGSGLGGQPDLTATRFTSHLASSSSNCWPREGIFFIFLFCLNDSRPCNWMTQIIWGHENSCPGGGKLIIFPAPHVARYYIILAIYYFSILLFSII